MRAAIVSIAAPPLIWLCCASAAIAQTNTEKTSPVILDQLAETAARDHKAGRLSNLDIRQSETIGARPTTESEALPKRLDRQAVTIEPVVGRDRCDPAEATARTAKCRNLIKPVPSQSADTGSGTPVTAEGRLLLLVNPNRPTMHDVVTNRPLSKVGSTGGRNASFS